MSQLVLEVCAVLQTKLLKVIFSVFVDPQVWTTADVTSWLRNVVIPLYLLPQDFALEVDGKRLCELHAQGQTNATNPNVQAVIIECGFWKMICERELTSRQQQLQAEYEYGYQQAQQLQQQAEACRQLQQQQQQSNQTVYYQNNTQQQRVYANLTNTNTMTSSAQQQYGGSVTPMTSSSSTSSSSPSSQQAFESSTSPTLISAIPTPVSTQSGGDMCLTLNQLQFNYPQSTSQLHQHQHIQTHHLQHHQQQLAGGVPLHLQQQQQQQISPTGSGASSPGWSSSGSDGYNSAMDEDNRGTYA